jgi:hypothetical protein
MARIVFTLEDGTEIEAELDSDVITIGRHSDSIVVLPSGSVSSHHATVKRRGDSYYVQDLGTTNGTKLNGVEVEEAKLEDGDQLTFGDIPAVVHLTEATRIIPSAIPMPSFSNLPAGAPPLPAKTSGSSGSGSGASAASGSSGRAQQVSQMARASGVRGRSPSHSRTVQYKESTGCAGFLTFLFFLVLAFLIGLHVRHGVVTGGFLLKDVMVKYRDKAESGADKHVEPEKPAEATPAPDAGKPATPPAPPAPGAAVPAAPAPGAPAPTPAPAGGGAMMDTMK